MPISKCIDCKEERSLAFETVKREKRHARSWFVAWLITFLILISLIFGILYIVLTSDIKVVKQSGSGVNNYIGNDGDVYNGTDYNLNNSKKHK